MDPLTLTQASEHIASGEVSPVELVETAVARIEQHDGQIGAFSARTVDSALSEARRAADRIARGDVLSPLHGIPIAVKTLIDRAGVESTSSSAVRKGRIPDTDATVVSRLKEAGAILVGQTHTHEFAYGVLTPTTRNPWNTDYVPGGSSGGSGAAVAAGMALGAIGTDTGGSVRIPSSVCGITGIKPTFGLVPRTGVMQLSSSLDHVGPMARTVSDNALLLQQIAGYDRRDTASTDPRIPDYRSALTGDVDETVIGVPSNFFFDHIDAEVESSFRDAIDLLEQAGARVREVEIPYADQYVGVEFAILASEASEIHRDAIRRVPELYTEDVRQLLEAGEFILATDYIKALKARTMIRDAWQDMFDGLDVVIAPTLPMPAVRAGQMEYRFADGTVDSPINAYVRASAPGNVTGLPAMSVPCGFSTTGLPIGMQIFGRPFDEPTVFRVGHAYEARTDFTQRVPDAITA